MTFGRFSWIFSDFRQISIGFLWFFIWFPLDFYQTFYRFALIFYKFLLAAMESPSSKVFAQEELQMRIIPCLTYTEIQRFGRHFKEPRQGTLCSDIEAWELEVQDELEASFGTPQSFYDTDWRVIAAFETTTHLGYLTRHPWDLELMKRMQSVLCRRRCSRCHGPCRWGTNWWQLLLSKCLDVCSPPLGSNQCYHNAAPHLSGNQLSSVLESLIVSVPNLKGGCM